MSLKTKINIFINVIPLIVCIYAFFVKQPHLASNSLLTVGCLVAVIIINKKVSVLSTGTYYSVLILILLSVFVGKGLKVYNIIPLWDKMLHFMSGFVFVSVGKNIYEKIKGNPANKTLTIFFVLSFALAMAGIWEIYEFSIDKLFNLNSQNNSLNDTMLDIIAGSSGSLIWTLLSFKNLTKQ